MGGTRQMWKVRLMVCLAVLNRLKIRMKNMDSEVFLFSSSKEIKTDGKKIYCSPYTSRKCWRWTLRSYLLLLISFFPWFFSLLLSLLFFTSNFFFFVFFLSFFLWILVYFSADRFSVWVFKPFFFNVSVLWGSDVFTNNYGSPFWCVKHIDWAYCFLHICDRRCITTKIAFIHDFIRSSHILFPYIHSHFFTNSRVFFGTNIATSSNWHVSSVGKALRRYRRGHGFKSRTGLNSFFKSYFHYCSSSVHHCEVRFHSRSTRDGEISHVGTVQTIPRISS